MQLAKTMRPDQSILVNLSGRGDKDIGTVADLSNGDFYCRPSCQGQSVKGGGAQLVSLAALGAKA
jgi:tryptophan synthase beta chain